MTVQQALDDVFAELGLATPADSDDLYTLGIDSLELVQTCIRLESSLSIEIDVKKLDKVKTMADLTKLIKAYMRFRGHTEDCPNPLKDCTCGFSEVFWEDPVRKMADELLLH